MTITPYTSPRLRAYDMTHAPWSSTPPIAGSPPPGPYSPPAPTHTPPTARQAGGLLRRAAVAAAFVACVSGAGVGGVIVGTHIASRPAPVAIAHPPSPSPEVVRAQTVDLCTRFAAAYAAIPTPQNHAADVVPAANYVADALRDNPAADPGVRAAMLKSLQLMRDQGAALSREPSKGAVQPPTGWTAATANAADDKVWALCNGYQE